MQQLVGRHRAAAGQVERREEGRVDFIQPVRVRTEDGDWFPSCSRRYRLISGRKPALPKPRNNRLLCHDVVKQLEDR